MGICNPLSPDAMKYIVRVPLVSAYAFEWIKANNPRDGIGDSVDFVKSLTTNRRNNGAIIHEGNERVAQNSPYGKWHHVSIEVDGELMLDAAAALPEPPQIQSLGNLSSILKARITLDLGNARVRTFDFDIGAGVEFEVAAYNVQEIEVLIPDPRVNIPFEPPVGGSDPGPQQLATVLTSTVYFTTYSGRQHNPLVYTTPVVLTVNDAVWFVPRVSDSIELSGGVDDIAVAAGDVIVDFIYVPRQLRAVTPTAPPAFFILDQIALEAGSSRFPRVLIPGNANAFRVRRAFGTPSTTVNLIQVLNA